jgi:hypothetical protein
MAPLKGEETCFAHSPKTRAERSAARARGGAANRRPSSAPAATAPMPTWPAFELGVIDRRGDIGAALLNVARAAARGALDTKTARVVTEALRSAEVSFAAGAREGGTGSGQDAPPGFREATPAEMEHLVKFGRLPNGVQALDQPFFVR